MICDSSLMLMWKKLLVRSFSFSSLDSSLTLNKFGSCLCNLLLLILLFPVRWEEVAWNWSDSEAKLAGILSFLWPLVLWYSVNLTKSTSLFSILCFLEEEIRLELRRSLSCSWAFCSVSNFLIFLLMRYLAPLSSSKEECWRLSLDCSSSMTFNFCFLFCLSFLSLAAVLAAPYFL